MTAEATEITPLDELRAACKRAEERGEERIIHDHFGEHSDSIVRFCLERFMAVNGDALTGVVFLTGIIAGLELAAIQAEGKEGAPDA